MRIVSETNSIVNNPTVLNLEPKSITIKTEKLKESIQELLTYDGQDNALKRRRLDTAVSIIEERCDNNISMQKTRASMFGCGWSIINRKHIAERTNARIGVIGDGKGVKINNVELCGSNACPICASRLSNKRSIKFKDLITTGRNNGRSYSLLVLTLQHFRNERISDIQVDLSAVMKYIWDNYEFRKLRELLGLRFIHKGLEVTIGINQEDLSIKNHPHYNFVFDFDYKLENVFELFDVKNEHEFNYKMSIILIRLAREYLKKNNIQRKLLEPYYNTKGELKGGITCTTKFDDIYITKWGLEKEITKSDVKKQKNEFSNYHPFYLLDIIRLKDNRVSDEYKEVCKKAYYQFVEDTKGLTWFAFARGSLKFYRDNFGLDVNAKYKAKIEESKKALDNQVKFHLIIPMYDYLNYLKLNPTKMAYIFSIQNAEDIRKYIFDEIERNKLLEKEALIKQMQDSNSVDSLIEMQNIHKINDIDDFVFDMPNLSNFM